VQAALGVPLYNGLGVEDAGAEHESARVRVTQLVPAHAYRLVRLAGAQVADQDDDARVAVQVDVQHLVLVERLDRPVVGVHGSKRGQQILAHEAIDARLKAHERRSQRGLQVVELASQ
jgi:hypothetical protein